MSRTSQIQEMQALFERCREAWRETDTQIARNFEIRIENFAFGLCEARQRDREYEERCAPRFNLFRILIGKKRETAHSAFLADLLNPKGSHGQGRAFLREFFGVWSEMSHLPHVEPDADSKVTDFEVITEKGTYNGRLDILLESRERGILFVIENKIDAAEQQNQLKRYAEWLSGKKNIKKGVLIVLAPEGRKPDDQQVKCVCLTYQKEIMTWIERCKSVARPARVIDSLQQYLEELNLMPKWESVSNGDSRTTQS